MFPQAFIYLQDALRLTQGTGPFNYHSMRQLLQAALSEVEGDQEQPLRLRRLASQQINQAISYSYSRTNPMMPPSMINTPPISPFPRPSQPYGFVDPTTLSPPTLPQGDIYSSGGRERAALRQLIRAAINTVRRGL